MYHPGDTVTLHWVADTRGGTDSGAAPVELHARLVGPFADVAALKRRDRAADAWSAMPLKITDQTGGAPASVLTIPAGAKPGLYDVRTTSTSDGGRVSAGSVVRVAQR